jgi:hypothetical protein
MWTIYIYNEIPLFWTQFDIKSVDRPLCKTLKQFSRIWFFLRIVGSNGFSGGKGTIWFSILYNGPLRKRTKSFGTLCRIMVRSIEWKRTLSDLEKVPNIVYQDVLKYFDSIWDVKGLIVTCSNFLITWNVRPQMAIISWFPLGLCWFYQGDCILQLTFQFVPKKIQKNSWRFFEEYKSMNVVF